MAVELHDFMVTRTMEVSWTVMVAAEDADAAEALAEELPEPSLCYQCSTPDVDTERAWDSDVSLDGAWEVSSVGDEGPHDCDAIRDGDLDACEHGPEDE